MPHVIIKMYPGRTEETKLRLAERIAETVAEVAGCNESSVSVSVEETPKEEWAEKVYKPDIIEKGSTLYRKPGYNPFT
ncbi:MAG: tautomerase family protein [Spirochaetota bacterium]